MTIFKFIIKYLLKIFFIKTYKKKIFLVNFFFKKILLNIYNFFPNKKLINFFLISGSDKYNNHKELYNALQLYKSNATNIFEIGIGGHDFKYSGGESLLALSKFYKGSKVFGLDIVDKSFLNNRQISTYTGSQIDRRVLNKIINRAKGFDIIIDDGSHFGSHQVKTFEIMFPRLNKGGVYIVEDLYGSFARSFLGDAKMNKNKNIVANVSQFVKSVYAEYIPNEFLSKLEKKFLINKVLFLENSVFIQKDFFKKKKVLDGKKC
jgi:demethylmacrocin O-methyltransferase